MFASVEVKDYTIQLDGKPLTIKKERWLGIVSRKDGVVTDEDEAKEAGEALDKLTKQIMGKKRKRNYGEYLDNLKNKYAKDEEDNGEIDEEEFQKISKAINKKSKGGKKSKSK